MNYHSIVCVMEHSLTHTHAHTHTDIKEKTTHAHTHTRIVLTYIDCATQTHKITMYRVILMMRLFCCISQLLWV